MEKVEDAAKKKKLKRVLCYFGLVFLTILLFVPMIFRMVFKEQKKEVKEDVITILSCQKDDESVRSTFLNDDPQSILYQIRGNYELNTVEDAILDNSDTMAVRKDSPVLRKLSGYGEVTYASADDISSIRFTVDSTKGTMDYELIFYNISSQKTYFEEQEFFCTTATQ